MLRNKFLLISLLAGMTVLPAFSDEILPDIEFPKPPAFRVGISEYPENQYIQAEEDKTSASEKNYARVDNSREAEIADYTYADLDLKRMSKDISQELDYDGQEMLSDLSLLWQGAAMQSETINFALYKLANPDADKPDEKSIKKVLTTIASMSTLVGASIGSPVIAGTSLISGNVLGIMTQDTKALNYKYTRVNDADMIILIRKVEDLQQKTVDLYYDYMSAKKQLEMINELVTERKAKFEYTQSNNAPRELIVITDAYYRTALDRQRTAKSEFFSKRAALEQFVGNETLLQFESELIAREKGEKTTTAQENQNAEYKQTVQNVEKFKENINAENTPAETVQPQTQAQAQPQPHVISQAQAPVAQVPTEKLVETPSVPLENFEQNKLNIAENTTEPKTDKVTGLSSNLETEEEGAGVESSKKSKKKSKVKADKSAKKEAKAEKETKENKVKKKINDKLIFLHGEKDKQEQTPEAAQDGSEVQQTSQDLQYQETVPQGNPAPKQKAFDSSGFLPLDEIKPPQLNGGYSIHSDYSYGDYYGEDSVQF